MNDKLDNVRPFSSHGPDRPQAAKEPGPYVGIFYVVQGTLYWEGVPVTRAEKTALFKIYPKNHYTFWKVDLARFVPEFKRCDQRLFPRGRVVYDPKTDVYELMTDKCILENKELIKRIESEMGLPESKVSVSHDSNCECEACRKGKPERKSEVDRHVDHLFQRTDDGGMLFFPRVGNVKWAYLIPTKEGYRRLRKKVKYWHLTLAVVGGFAAELIPDYVAHSRHPFWTGIAVIVLFGILSGVCGDIWLRRQTRQFKKVDGNWKVPFD